MQGNYIALYAIRILVIDFCLVKCLVCDPETNYQSLRMQWTSHASATQRKGTYLPIVDTQKMLQFYCFKSALVLAFCGLVLLLGELRKLLTNCNKLEVVTETSHKVFSTSLVQS